MKRLSIVTAGVALIAAVVATWSLAAPAESVRQAGPAAATAAPKLPPLPANIKSRKRFIIGVKCDAPPFGYINVQGRNAGFDVEIARWFSRYAFGRDNRVTFECAPTAVRESLLTTDRADMIISTFTYTADRSSKLTDDTFLALPYGIGIKQGNTALKSWVDSRLELMRKKDTFMSILKNNVPARFVNGFSKNILRPNNTFGYAPAGSPSADTVCP